MVFSTLQAVMVIRTIIPPSMAQFPGLSPITKKTQSGFKIGSTAVINTNSRELTPSLARVKR